MSDAIRMMLLECSKNGLVEAVLMGRGRTAELLDRIAELEAENDRLQSSLFRDETICPDGSLRPKVSDLLNRIAELEEKQRWRVVADGELPEVYRDEDGDFIPFLVCEGDGDYPFTARYDGINWRAGIFVPDITHWMPLPELPEVQE